MAAIADITVQLTVDPNARVYHTRFEFASSPQAGMRGCAPDLGEFGQLVLAIDGVVHVSIAPYMMVVNKAPLFSWDEVEPQIQGILKEFVISQKQIEDAYANPAPTANDRVPRGGATLPAPARKIAKARRPV